MEPKVRERTVNQSATISAAIIASPASTCEHGIMLSLLFAVTVSLSQMAEADFKELKTLADFHAAQPDLVWTAVNDNVMGGRSSGGFALTGGRLLFRGEINTDGGGFASIRTEPQQLDIGSHDGLKLKVRGDGRTYRFRVVTAGSDFAYMADFSTRKGEWEIIDLPFSAFQPSWRGRKLDRPPVKPSDITSIGFMIADKQDGEFALEVEWIKLISGES